MQEHPSPPARRVNLTGTGYCAAFNFRRAARAVTRAYDEALQQAGMRSTQFAILVAVAKAQPASITRLSEITLIDSSTLTRSLRLLSKDGWVTVSGREQMRQRFVQITPKGERALGRALVAWRSVQNRFVGAVGDDYWRSFRAELERLAHLAAELGTH
jgi:DNA-binding MarR family transcriptional regulator